MVSTEQFNRKKIAKEIQRAFQELDILVNKSSIDAMAEMIFQSMSGPWRVYHTPEHIFDLISVGYEDPIIILAALFHDIVYVQVDASIYFNLTHYLSPFIEQQAGQMVIKAQVDVTQSQGFELVLSLFGFSYAQVLSPYGGQNEFLSAIVAMQVLEPFLPLSLIAEIIVCIESTIPFRTTNDSGTTPINLLAVNLCNANSQFTLGLSDADIHTAITRAVILSNQDVASFADPSVASFLDTTWQLLPETNKALSRSTSYTVKEYRVALQKMEKLFSFVQPAVIFQQYGDIPDGKIYSKLIGYAQINLRTGQLYMRSKIITMAILEALSSEYSVDAPIASIMGDLPSHSKSNLRLTDFLPKLSNPYQPKDDMETIVLNLLEHGRGQTIDYDIANSPMSTFIAKSIGFNMIEEKMTDANLFFAETLSPDEFISRFSSELRFNVVSSLIAFMRKRLDILVDWTKIFL